MRPRTWSSLLPLVCLPAVSYILQPARVLLPSRELRTQPGVQTASGRVHCRRLRADAPAATQGGGKKRRRVTAVGEESTKKQSNVASTSRVPLSWTPPNDAVSCLQNPETGSRLWLVGIVHQAIPYVDLVKRAIREIKPQVVMLELDPASIFLLPAGKTQQSSNGLWWWKPEPQAPGRPGTTKRARRKQCRNWPGSPRNPAMEAVEDVDEIWTAGREAQACGARVLLGDRNTEVSQRRECEADRTDSETLRKISAAPSPELERLERAGKGLQMLTKLIERRRQSGLEMPETRAIVRKHSELHRLLGPRAFKVVVTERDEVMAKNLMALEGNHSTVAVVGSAHLDGMENILSANGWRVKTTGRVDSTETT